ncbi:MAG: class I SAM-dependent methyltransferase [Thermoguttaceae bacterium]
MKPMSRNHDPYAIYRPLMKRFGARCSPKEFYWAVNDALHAAEAATYDVRHATMYLEAGGAVWERLFSYLPSQPEELRFLDIGCGTGLVGHFAAMYVPHRVASMMLMDPSPNMMKVVQTKATNWPFDAELRTCDIDGLATEKPFDVVTINSVLHHVVELEPFVKKVQDLIRPGGVLLTGQDPRAVAKTRYDCLLTARRAQAAPSQLSGKASRSLQFWRNHVHRVLRQVGRMIGSKIHLTELAKEASRTLLDNDIIRRPMDETSLYMVTDVHIPRSSGGGKGIDEDDLEHWMQDMTRIATHTYRYHDANFAQLNQFQKEQELAWWRADDLHGATMALAFRKCA